jgi:hypothetical protein
MMKILDLMLTFPADKPPELLIGSANIAHANMQQEHGSLGTVEFVWVRHLPEEAA